MQQLDAIQHAKEDIDLAFIRDDITIPHMKLW
jgi:hypothetical protein